MPPVVAEVRQDEGDDVGRARRGREPASLDARKGAPHDVDVGDRRPGGRQERDRPGLVGEGDRLGRERHEAGASPREEDEEEVLRAEPRGESEGLPSRRRGCARRGRGGPTAGSGSREGALPGASRPGR